MGNKTNLKTALVMAVILLGFGCATAAGGAICVDADASPGGNGTTWGMAYKYLQDALYKPPTGGDEIWVAEGTYKPDQGGGQTPGARTATFQLINGVAIYGGFVGTETSREQRDWQTNETILSGDLNGDDVGFTNNGENSYHVVTGSETDATAVLDGFTITAGNANSDVWPDDGGGGINNYQGSPTIRNCTLRGNSCFADGGGIRNWGNSKPIITHCTFSGNSSGQEGGGIMNGKASSPTVTNCTFSGNSAGEDGGGMYSNDHSNAMVTNCTFIGNTVKLTGGGMYNVNSSCPTVTNCTFSKNSAEVGGGGISNYKASIKVKNCIFWNNSAPDGEEIYLRSTKSEFSSIDVDYCDVREGQSGIYLEGTGNIIHWGADNIDADPKFADEELRLSAGSPCIDAGDNTAVSGGVTTDLAGNPRFVDDPLTTDTGNGTPPIVDMGAYEYRPPVMLG
jgi:parallel beta-helix repeat protein/predicted outer membrane repeat protein